MWGDVLDGRSLTAEALARAAVVVAVEVLLLGTSFLNICVIFTTADLYDVIGCYLISLSVADLLAALFIVPLSLYSTLDPSWRFMGDNSLVCKGSAYLQIALFCSTVYTFAWICIDRYSAMMKPSRYADQSLTRCKCWIVFSWLTSLLLCCPIVVAQMQVVFLEEAQLCVLDWSATSAYSMTLLVLVFLPTIVTVFNTGYKIIRAMRNPDQLEDSQRMVIETDPNFVLTMFLLVAFVLSWLPLLCLKVFEYFIPPQADADLSLATFIFVWLAIAGPSAKFLIYMFINGAFRSSVDLGFAKIQPKPARDVLLLFGVLNVLFLFYVFHSGKVFSVVNTKETESSADAKNMASVARPALSRLGNIRVIYVTAPSKDVALKIAKAAVEKKVAACANIIPGVTSVYEWEGKMNEDSEVVLIMKTQESLVEELHKLVIENHTYDVPAFVSLATDAESFPYAKWVLEQTNSSMSNVAETKTA
ncbi:hypothetical protein Q1695_000600 [Nippostrongylus brasiliensis]|nr:hypothetical protein Q1695_000600 [Nippostrongylus brasiliensis]